MQPGTHSNFILSDIVAYLVVVCLPALSVAAQYVALNNFMGNE
jgi:hypothetical protein